MIFWHPNGWTIYQVLEKYIRGILKKNDYLEIKTPQAVDKSLWEKSGHWENLETICSLLHQKIELMQLNQ